MANQYAVNPLGGFNPAQHMDNLTAQNKAEARDAEALQSQRDQKLAFQKALSGKPEDMETLAGVSPQMFQWMDKRQQKREQVEGVAMAQLKENTEREWLVQYRQALDSGDENARTRLIQQAVDDDNNDLEHGSIGKDIEMDKSVVNIALYRSLGKDGYKEFYGSGGGADKPAGQLEFEALIKDFSPKQQQTAKLVKAGLKGRAMSNAELSAIESGEIKNYSDWKAQMKQAQKFAEMTGSSRAKAIDKGFDSIVKIDAGIRNIDRAVAAIESGAGVGAVEKLWPSIKAASVELDNIRGQMALDVVGATTFGALSKGELDLAKDIALPTGLDSDELVKHLKDKKIAQEKLRTYYNKQIQFLDQGGTIAGFLREKERDQANKQPLDQPSQQRHKQGGQIMTDANGNRAMVYPDGTFEEL